MRIQKTLISLLAAVLLTASFANTAHAVPPTKTFEASIMFVRLPNTANGTISLRECRTCDYESIRTTANTRYLIDGKNMSLDKYRTTLSELRSKRDYTVNVRRDENSNTVSSVFLYTR